MTRWFVVFSGRKHFSSNRDEKVRAKNMTWKKIVVAAVLVSFVGCKKEEEKRITEMPRMAPRPMTVQAGIPQSGRYDSRRFSRTEDLNLRDQLEALPDIEVKTDDNGQIIYVDFRKAGGGGNEQITWLYGLPFVETLILAGQQVDNAMLSVVAGHPNLKVLNVAQQSSVDNDALPLLLSLKKLEDLSLEGSKFTDDNLEELVKISTLRKLRLRGTGVTAAGIKKLTDLAELEVLDLRDCSEIGNTGLEAIGGFAKLKSLLVNGENVTDEGVVFLKRLTELQLLVLPRSQVTDAGIASLSELRKLKELDLFQAPISDVGLATFAEAKDLVKLKIRGTKVTSEGLRVIEKYEKLTELDLSETAVDDTAIEFISHRTSLVDVNFLRTQITSQGVKKLATMKLKRLNLDDVKGVDDTCLPAVASMESLEFLHLGKTAVSDEGVSVLAQLKGLKTLILENTPVSPAKIEELKAALPSTEIKYSVGGAAAG
jgi:hypothetical protein